MDLLAELEVVQFEVDLLAELEVVQSEVDLLAELEVVQSEVDLLAELEVVQVEVDLLAELEVVQSEVDLLAELEVVQFEVDLLAELGAYRPSLSTVVARRRVGQHDAGDVTGRGVLQRRRRHAFPACLARHRRHCSTMATRFGEVGGMTGGQVPVDPARCLSQNVRFSKCPLVQVTCLCVAR